MTLKKAAPSRLNRSTDIQGDLRSGAGYCMNQP